MSTFALKIIACVAMLFDHIGYFVMGKNMALGVALRAVGRIAFPIYCYLIAFGFRKTHNSLLYLLRLLLIGVISELPYNYFVAGRFPAFGLHNVFFTLSLGLIGLICYEKLSRTKLRFSALLPAVLCVILAQFIGCDYGGYGVALIIMFYFAHKNRFFTSLVCILFSSRKLIYLFVMSLFKGISISTNDIRWDLMQLFAVLSLLPIFLCNGARGPVPKNKCQSILLKYSFYLFYPVHLTLLATLFRNVF